MFFSSVLDFFYRILAGGKRENSCREFVLGAYEKFCWRIGERRCAGRVGENRLLEPTRFRFDVRPTRMYDDTGTTSAISLVLGDRRAFSSLNGT